MIHPQLKSRIDEDICVLLTVDNHPGNYILDCGVASELTVTECVNTRVIFVSHTHIDHFSNFMQIVRHQLNVGRALLVCGPAGIARQVQSQLQSYSWNLIPDGHEKNLWIEVREVTDPDEIKQFRIDPPGWELKKQGDLSTGPIFENRAFQVEFAILDHGLPSLAYLFSEPSTVKIDVAQAGHQPGPWINALKNAFLRDDGGVEIEIGDQKIKAASLFHLLHRESGYRFGFIMDHAITKANHEQIIKLFLHADQVWIESFYTLEEQEFADLNHHSTADASGRVMFASKVGQAVPVHYSRRYHSGDEHLRLIAEFERAFNGQNPSADFDSI